MTYAVEQYPPIWLRIAVIFLELPVYAKTLLQCAACTARGEPSIEVRTAINNLPAKPIENRRSSNTAELSERCGREAKIVCSICWSEFDGAYSAPESLAMVANRWTVDGEYEQVHHRYGR